MVQLRQLEQPPSARAACGPLRSEFNLENGRAQLTLRCARVAVTRRRDWLRANRLEPVVQYLRSLTGGRGSDPELGRAQQLVTDAITRDGHFGVQTESGLFRGRRRLRRPLSIMRGARQDRRQSPSAPYGRAEPSEEMVRPIEPARPPNGCSPSSSEVRGVPRRRPYTQPMADPDQDSEAPSETPETGPPAPPAPLPEFLNPESTHYQPWAEKQIFNAAKEKRSLDEFMVDFQARLDAYSDLPEALWDPQHQDQLLARFAVGTPGRSKRHRRRRGAGQASAAVGTNRRQPAEGQAGRGRRASRGPATPAALSQPPTAPIRPGGEHRRRRRRSRGRGSGPPVAPPTA
jgi:hypothetical protein